jgi:alpha-L-fucosidase
MLKALLVAGSLLGLGLFCLPPGAAQPGQPPPETPDQRAARMQWWRDAKFGLFIHWGVYAVPAGTYHGKPVPNIGEWIMRTAEIPVAEYRGFARQFNPVKYDPEAWAAVAQEAGMKYIVITSKHHDGFALFDSKVTDWDIVDATPYRKEVLGPLAAAARKRGLKFGLYYSQAQDWTHPGGAKAGLKDGEGWDPAHKGSFDDYLQKVAVPQVREILTTYQPDILWWDTPMLMTKERADRLRPLTTLRPGLILNDRLGGGYPGDTETPEQHIPATGYVDRDWEVCMTMNDTWGYKSYDHDWKSTEDLVRKLCDIVSKGGNFLLNVGPTAEGEIPAASIERLKQIGAWMNVNGEAIYGTTASPFTRLSWGRCTKKTGPAGTTLYLHVFDWPAEGQLLVPGLKSPVKTATLLAGGARLPAQTNADGVLLRVPATAPSPYASVLKLELGGPLQVEKILPRPAADGTLILSALDVDVHNTLGTDAKVETKGGQPNVGYWTDPRAWVSWRFRLDRPGTYEVVADLASTDSGARFQVGAGGQTLAGTAPNTGDYGRFQKVTLGRLAIGQPGEQELAVRPVPDGWKPVNLRSITLRPVAP